MDAAREPKRIDTVVIGGGQAGLSAGYHLRRKGLPSVIIDADPRIGDHWREHWDSLKLYSPARFDALPGMPFPAADWHYPTGREMGDYLEAYAAGSTCRSSAARAWTVSRRWAMPRAATS